jgi:hypothetical protein
VGYVIDAKPTFWPDSIILSHLHRSPIIMIGSGSNDIWSNALNAQLAFV